MQNYPNPFPHVTPPTNPKRKSYLWALIIGVIFVVVGLLLWGAISLGKRVGQQMEEGFEMVKQQEAIQDSIDAIRIDSLYAGILEADAPDSAYMSIQQNVESLRNRTDKILELFTMARDSFRSFLPDSSGITMLNAKYSKEYFITSGRALRLKLALESYEESVIMDLPEQFRDDSVSVFTRTKIMSAFAPSPIKGLYTWENQNFNQPPGPVLLNFKLIQHEIETFEEAILEKYASLPVTTTVAPDSTSGI